MSYGTRTHEFNPDPHSSHRCNEYARHCSDFTYKLSAQIMSRNDITVLEDLNIQGMMKNHHLAKSIVDASWNMLVQFITCKAESAGKTVVQVNPENTSKKCSKCGNIKGDLKLSCRIYHCNVCGLTIDRDLNAAINTHNTGLINIGGTPEFMPVKIGALLARATPIAEAGSPRF